MSGSARSPQSGKIEMSAGSPFLIDELPGFAPQISHLVVMLNYARRTTLEAAAGLTVAQLDHLHDERSNSVGALLAHIAAIEFSYRLGTLEDRGFTPQEWRRWSAPLQLGPQARAEIRGEPLSHYLDLLSEVRTQTLAELSRRTDDWLYEQSPFWQGLPANNYFKWFHVLEDEINHRGQIRWLRQRLPSG